ncbi:hypothetical protein DYD21_06380 [Rhodohalobacter sp. SW132]|uniref:hypothetical protein n=1 Tax=Rhodohalobacter sp. SW132 TaxID=2293433 RepID=UPI000E2474DF|nr:hypothetical protein [Rhodohalobacter sp. SW132]REL38231.1 hypothetical protein DYD21_06380 [Rhodohalobacter sp. SW132]
MSYALRNTLILLMVLIFITAGGYLIIHFYQLPQIDKLEQTIETDQAEYDNKREIADRLPDLEQQFVQSKEFIENFDKTLFRTNNPDQVYRFLSILSDTDPIQFDYIYTDSTQTDRYGVVTSQLAGRGPYRAVLNFMTRIENSEPVQKIEELVISPVSQVDEYTFVTFNFRLRSFYDRHNYFNARNTPGVSGQIQFASHNPFFPLIRNVDPNTDDLIDVEQSQLVGIGSGIVYLLDQNGRLQTLQERDRVYLGRLESININQGYAIFRLNKGGIVETVSLEVQR